MVLVTFLNENFSIFVLCHLKCTSSWVGSFSHCLWHQCSAFNSCCLVCVSVFFRSSLFFSLFSLYSNSGCFFLSFCTMFFLYFSSLFLFVSLFSNRYQYWPGIIFPIIHCKKCSESRFFLATLKSGTCVFVFGGFFTIYFHFPPSLSFSLFCTFYS